MVECRQSSSVLSLYYKHVCTLRQHVQSVAIHANELLASANEQQSAFLDTTRVAFNEATVQAPAVITVQNTSVEMHDVSTLPLLPAQSKLENRSSDESIVGSLHPQHPAS